MVIKKIFSTIGSTIKLISLFIGAFILITAFMILLFRWVNPPVTSFMQLKSLGEISDFWDPPEIEIEWVSIDNIPKHMSLAVIASEDQRFFEHFGYDIVEIEKAIKERERKRRVRGASTISQQTAKNIFLPPDKSMFRKGMELYFTFLIELFWSKERILEVYLNVVEFAPNVYGVEAASQKFYKKSAVKLNSSQSALLAAVLPNPKRFSVAKPSRYILNRRDRILKQMQNLGGSDYVKENFE
ncbi:MAG: monofunctional biosynthetic peptidoglycan transglycosylase [bacterium]